MSPNSPSSNGRCSGSQAWYSISPNYIIPSPDFVDDESYKEHHRSTSIWPSSWTLSMTGTFFTSMNSLVRGGTDKLKYKNKIRETRSKTLSIYEETIIAVPTDWVCGLFSVNKLGVSLVIWFWVQKKVFPISWFSYFRS